MASNPAVTVLMPVYNGARHLSEAVDSILGQSFTDFELLAIDDASSDDSVAVIKRRQDPRIRLIENPCNRGIAGTLNEGLRLARGEYIARMDCDDISLPQRIERQYAFMQAHPRVGACGSWVDCFGELEQRWRYPATQEEIACAMLFYCPLAHPTAFLRKQTLEGHGITYADDAAWAEDYELWSRIHLVADLANLDEVLLRYRRHPAQTSERDRRAQAEAATNIQGRLLERIGLHANEDELRLHASAVRHELSVPSERLGELAAWFSKVVRANQRTRLHPDALLGKLVLRYWWKACRSHAHERETWSLFRNAEVFRMAPWKDKAAMSALLLAENALAAPRRGRLRRAQ